MADKNVTIPKVTEGKKVNFYFFNTYPTHDQLRACAKQFGCKSTALGQPAASNKGNGFMVFPPRVNEEVTVTLSDTDE